MCCGTKQKEKPPGREQREFAEPFKRLDIGRTRDSMWDDAFGLDGPVHVMALWFKSMTSYSFATAIPLCNRLFSITR